MRIIDEMDEKERQVEEKEEDLLTLEDTGPNCLETENFSHSLIQSVRVPAVAKEQTGALNILYITILNRYPYIKTLLTFTKLVWTSSKFVIELLPNCLILSCCLGLSAPQTLLSRQTLSSWCS